MKFLQLLIVTVIATTGVCCSSSSKIKHARNLSSDKAPYNVILMGGQSNMVGQGKQADLTTTAFPNVTFYDFGLNVNLNNSKDNFGPEVGLSKVLSKNFPDKKFILIKYAIGGASLLDWAPNYDKQKAKITGHPQFGNMYQKLLFLTDSLTQGRDVKIVALLWMQGERDARIPEAGKAYYQNFKHLIRAVRKDFKAPKLPVIFGKINPPRAKWIALDTVVNAQIRISKRLPNTYLIDTDHIEKWRDNLHYSSNGQLELGVKFGEKLTDLLRN